MSYRSLIPFATAAILLAGTAHAADLPERDRAFLRTQAQGTAYELAIARLAAGKAAGAEVRAYAQMLVTDHDRLNAELRQLAVQRGVELPPDMTARQQADLARLGALEGAAFDRAYKRETTRINRQDVAEDRAEQRRATDPDLRAFVGRLAAQDAKHAAAGRRLRPS